MERQRLFGGRTGNDILLLYNLRKCYGGFSKKNIAVESISLGIPKGEILISNILRRRRLFLVANSKLEDIRS
ncbi:hypothetical protein AV530_016135 [Patagioenas fasciata monilis]|uniref:Uncharacterized protein n=1 Tax=Patagioenas fasciata monilis TaxID=372326 RepID=A0A1V4JWC7_PATFA|nr:hypothetical protein AV530_016135 [Patagioenas fasciata monilis]